MRTVPLLSHLLLTLTLTPTLSPTLPLYPSTPYPCQVPLLSHRCLRLRCAHPECRKHALLMQRPPLDCDLCARPLQHPMRSFFEFAADMQTALQARVRVRVRLRLRLRHHRLVRELHATDQTIDVVRVRARGARQRLHLQGDVGRCAEMRGDVGRYGEM